ncbi:MULTISPECIES: type I secretion system permease/ATPase [Thalassospira]|uniref:Peptidase n=2 Tax=Thalassospira tepidiphila TaxID=393657 RepID=A0A853L4D9_9PROT|nr:MULTISPECIES: type I secretion system permease/ATPase [Thalassospira]MBO6817524.1 type I secretion system permease/ATPase [Thalassospira sp.]MBO6887176.1 type I secretion system permease/ATPase [Thalassospira sp.]NJB73634.1 PrtD family type I secretion system ABC transporter [Thalassospira tepidiphila]OAZ12178.1 peptidase [Thalassospira tepidiphila MCCC 1A03514]
MSLLDRIRPTRKSDAGREGDRTPLERLFWRSIALVGGFSMVINLLNMVIPIYSMQVFDRVLSSRSVDTLALLTLGIGLVLVFIASMEQLRSRVLIRVGTALDLRLGGELFAHVVQQSARGSQMRQRPLRDLYGLRGFLTGSGPFALIDFMWAPVYIGVVFIFDTRLGMVACGGALLLIVIAIANEAAAKISVDRSEESQNRGIAQEETYVRNAEAMEAMGMTQSARQRWQADQSDSLYWEGQASRRVGTSTTLSHFVRLAMQVCFIGVGAYLVLSESITIGIMVASMILGMRGLAPFDGAVTAWRSWNAARSSFERLNNILLEKRQTVPAPMPRGRGMSVSVDRLVFAPPNSRNVLFKGFSFKAGPGQIIAIAGFNGVGKTALLKLIMGIWLPGSGSVKLDDVEASRADRTEMGAQIGYLAQNPFLFPGTIAENIARLGNAEMRDIIQAAELAGAHQFILDLPDGYDTRVDRGGRNLSGGQRQLIALAAALFSRPRLLLLDEPTTALDDNGVTHISELIDVLRRNGITTFIVSHEREILARADAILALADGQIQVVPVKGGAKSAVSKPVPESDQIARGLPPMSRPAEPMADALPSDGQMRITPKQIAVPNPDAPRPIVEKNTVPNTHPAAAMSAPEPEVGIEETPEIADFGATGEAGSGRAQAAKQAAGIAKTEMKPQPTPGGTMMTMRPVSKKQAATNDAARKDPPARASREARPASAADLAPKRAPTKPKAQPERAAQAARKPAPQRKMSEAEAIAKAREEAAMRMRKVREDAERAAAARAPRRKPAEAEDRPMDRAQPSAQNTRRGRPQLRVVEGSAERRQGGA